MPTCGQASSMRAMPENEIPPAPPGDHYFFLSFSFSAAFSFHLELSSQVQRCLEKDFKG